MRPWNLWKQLMFSTVGGIFYYMAVLIFSQQQDNPDARILKGCLPLMHVRKRYTGFIIVLIIILGLLLSGCTGFTRLPSGTENTKEPSVGTSPTPQDLKRALFYDSSEGLADITAPADFNWKKYEGITLNFISENNVYANVLSREVEQFTKITGIKVKIQSLDFNSMLEKINLDFVSKTGKYQIVYVDPYQTLTKFSKKLVDLNSFNNNEALPHIPGGIEDFFRSQVDVDSYFLNRDKLYTVPFDSPTMILFYRKDILEKYGEKFKADKGYEIIPGDKSFTWEKYYEFAKWINYNVPKDEVKFGCGHQAKQHNSLFVDFSNVLAAYGGNYFKDRNIGSLGAEDPYNSVINDGKGIRALEMYKKILDVADPRSFNWEWLGAAEAFKNGDIAMMPNWNEYVSVVENTEKSKVAGKVGYSLLPYGPAQSGNIYGGSGIGINSDAPLREQEAAWLFIIWATSPQTELLVLKYPEGGDVPLRKSLYNLPEIKKAMVDGSAESKKYPALLPMQAVLKAWEIENIYQRPKISKWPQVEAAITDELYKMITRNVSADETAMYMERQIDLITGQY